MSGGVRSSTRTENEQLGPTAVAHVTTETPTGKNESEGGKQLIAPQFPVVARLGYFTMAPHCESFVGTVICAPQLIVQGALPDTRVAVPAELFAGLGSETALEAEAVFVMIVPVGVARPTCTPITKVEIVPDSRSG